MSAECGLDQGVDDEEEPQRPAMSPMVSPASSVTSKASGLLRASGSSRASKGSVMSSTSAQSPNSVVTPVAGKKLVSVAYFKVNNMGFFLLGPTIEGGVNQGEESEEPNEERFLLSCQGQVTIQLVTAAEADAKEEAARVAAEKEVEENRASERDVMLPGRYGNRTRRCTMQQLRCVTFSPIQLGDNSSRLLVEGGDRANFFAAYEEDFQAAMRAGMEEAAQKRLEEGSGDRIDALVLTSSATNLPHLTAQNLSLHDFLQAFNIRASMEEDRRNGDRLGTSLCCAAVERMYTGQAELCKLNVRIMHRFIS